MTEIISGQDLIDAGMRQGKWFGPALDAANGHLAAGGSFAEALEIARGYQPPPTLPPPGGRRGAAAPQHRRLFPG